MFTTFLKGITGFFERHFLITAFFPTLLFVALNIGMLMLDSGISTLITWWSEQSAEYQTVLAVTVLCGTLMIAYLISIFQPTLTRLFEGYWDSIPLLRGMIQRRRAYYQSIWQYLKDEMERADKVEENVNNLELDPIRKELEELRSRFDTINESQKSDLEKEILDKRDALDNLKQERIQPIRAERRRLEGDFLLFFPPEKAMVLPTRLGNILRASEAYGAMRYGLDAVVIWPRLYSMLPDEAKRLLSYSKANLDLFLILTVLISIFALYWQISSVILVNWVLFVLASLSWIVVIICYRAALQAAVTYSEVVKSTIDLHRWALLKALHIKLPASYQEEQRIWQEITDLFYRSYSLNKSKYETAKENQKPKKEPSKKGLLEKIAEKWKKWRSEGSSA